MKLRDPAKPLPYRLTPTDLRLLAMLADGLTQQQTARRLNVCDKTLRRRLARIYQAIGAHTAAHAVAITIRAGLLPAPDRRTHQQ